MGFNPDINSKEIINGCLKRRRDVQQYVFEALYGKMYVICLRYAQNQDEAKDLLQEGFIKVFEKVSKYKGNGSFEGWIRRTITNNAIDYYRKNKNKRSVSFEDHYASDEAFEVNDQEDESSFLGVKSDDILEAISKLSPSYKAVFNLYVIENYTHKEIAEILDISIGTSKSNYAKAKKRLKELLKDKIIY